MQIFNVGPDELASYEFDYIDQSKYEWFIYWYIVGDYEGGGEAVALRNDGKLQAGSLSHCSCYGPLDDGNDYWKGQGDGITVEEFLTTPTCIYENDYRDELKEKVRELMKV